VRLKHCIIVIVCLESISVAKSTVDAAIVIGVHRSILTLSIVRVKRKEIKLLAQPSCRKETTAKPGQSIA